MKHRNFFTSLTRISDLPEVSFSVEPLSRREWETGDYVVGEVTSAPNKLSRIELTSGRMVEVVEGDLIVGAFGVRYATLESVGGWQAIRRDRMMEALTGAGLFGRATSSSALLPSLLSLAYKGHVLIGGEKATSCTTTRRTSVSRNCFAIRGVLPAACARGSPRPQDEPPQICAQRSRGSPVRRPLATPTAGRYPAPPSAPPSLRELGAGG